MAADHSNQPRTNAPEGGVPLEPSSEASTDTLAQKINDLTNAETPAAPHERPVLAETEERVPAYPSVVCHGHSDAWDPKRAGIRLPSEPDGWLRGHVN